MKNKFLNYISIIIILISFYFILTNNSLINNNILLAVNLWLTKLLPSLFPMIIINELLIYFEFPEILEKLFIKNKLINNKIIYIFIMSIFSGTPANAYIIKRLLDDKEITKKEASITLSFTFFSNPLFLINMLSKIFNYYITIKIILIHYLTNIFIFLIFYKQIKNEHIKEIFNNNQKKLPLTKVLNVAIKNSVDTLLIVLGTIIFYILIGTIIINLISPNLMINTILKGFLEITQGLNSLINLNINNKLKEMLAISFISFGGLSIHSQIKSILTDTNIELKYFAFGRLLHVLISITLILII